MSSGGLLPKPLPESSGGLRTIYVSGPMGNQGFQGVQGPFDGPMGPQGNQGWQGGVGVMGNQGYQGQNGSQGNQGFQGISGAQSIVNSDPYPGTSGRAFSTASSWTNFVAKGGNPTTLTIYGINGIGSLGNGLVLKSDNIP